MNSQVLHTVGWVLVHSLWQFAAIGGLAWLLDCCVKRRSSAVRYNILLVALLLMALCPIVTAPLVFEAQKPALAGVQQDPASPLSVGDGPGILPLAKSETAGSLDPQVASKATLVAAGSGAAAPEVGRSDWWFDPRLVASHIARWIDSWLAFIVGAWCVGVLFFAARLSVGWWRIRLLIRGSATVTDLTLLSLLQGATARLGIYRKLQLMVSGSIESPVVVGVLRSMIVIPTSFASGVSPELVEAIFAHELAHVRRYDYPVNLIQSILDSLFFYHPMVWWLSRRIREERENCCDDMAAAAMRSPVTVGRALLALEELRSRNLSPALAAGGGTLAARVRRLLGKQPPRNSSSNAVSLISVVLLVSLLAGVTGLAIASAAEDDDTDVSVNIEPVSEPESNDVSISPNLLLPESRNVHSLRFAGDSTICSVAYGTGKGREGHYPRVRRWNLQTKEMIGEVPLQWQNEWTRHTNELVLAEDAKLVFGSLGDELGVWDSETGELLRRMKPKWEEFGDLTLRYVTPSQTGSRVACTGLSNSTAQIPHGHIYVWNGRSGELIRAIRSDATGTIRSFAFSDDGRHVAAWPAKGGVGIWDVDTGRQVFTFKNSNPPGTWPGEPMHPSIPDQVLGLQFSHDGRTLAIGDLVGVKIIDTATGTVQQTVRAPYRYNSPTFVFSPDDRLLLRYGVHLEDRRESLLWDLRTGEQLAAFPIEGSAAAFSASGDQLAIGRSDPKQAIAVWQLAFASEVGESNDDQDVYWHDRGTEQWTTGVRILKRPTAGDPTLIVQYLLRNDADVPRTADLSFTAGPSRFFVKANHRIESWAGAEGSHTYIEKFAVEAGGELVDSRFRQQFDLAGLEPAIYQLQLRPFFTLPTDQPGTRHGIPLDHQLSVQLNLISPLTNPDEIQQKTAEQNTRPAPSGRTSDNHRSGSAEIRWGEPVGGLRSGIAWTTQRDDSPPVFRHGDLVEADLFVQNVSGHVLQCELTLPHSMDGWGFSIHNLEGKHMPRNQTFFTGFESQRDFTARIEPGETMRITGRSDFAERTPEGFKKPEVPRLQFKVAAELPGAEVVPPYTYGLSPGEYTLKAFVNVRRASNPSATLMLDTDAAKFRVASDASTDAGEQKQNGIEPGENDPALTVRPINAMGESVSLAYLTLWRALEPDEAQPVNQVNGPNGFGFYDPVIWEDPKHNARWIRAGSANPNDGRHGWDEKAFHFRSLKPGRYRVTAVTYRREGKTPDPTPWGVSDPFFCGGTMPVSIDVALTEGNADFTVRIVDTETREPIPGLALRLRTASGVPIVHGHGNGNFFERTGDNGEVRYGQLKAGEFTVQVLGKLAEVNDFIQYEPVENPVPVEVKRGGNSIEIAVDQRRLSQAEINKRFPFSVFGRVTDEAGNPMAGVEVRAATGMGTLRGGGRTQTDSDGKYRLYFGPGLRTRKHEDYAPLGIGVQAAHFYAEKLGWTLDAKDGYLFYLMTDQTPRQFEAMLKQEGGKYWGKDSAEEVVFATQPRELNFVLKHSRDAP